MPFLAKYFIKKKGKGFKERLQGKYKKRENTTEILEGELTFDVIKSAFPTGIYFLVVLTLILRRIAKLGCVAFTRSFVDLCFILTVHIVLNVCISIVHCKSKPPEAMQTIQFRFECITYSKLLFQENIDALLCLHQKIAISLDLS